jgi:serine/threonine protein kinase
MGEKVALGDVLAGKYRVEKVLGSGGMGVVVAARDEQRDLLVVLKFMADDALKDPDLVLRFLRDGRAVERLCSEHVARITDVGTLESGAPYRVMEHLEGSDLSAVLQSEGPQPIGSAADYIVQACEALGEAHGTGIVHRAIKPSNLFLTQRPNGSASIKVLDFGISKSELLGSSAAKLHATHSRAVLGSALYMAPEQMRAAPQVDARADIWALGVTLYELLTGRVPFEADSLPELALKVARGDPVSTRKIRSEIPSELDAVVLQCIEKDRDRRFSSAAMLASALAQFAVRRKAELPGATWSAERTQETPEDTFEDLTPVVPAPVVADSESESARPPQEAVLPPTPPPPLPTPAPPPALPTPLPLRAVTALRAIPPVARGSVPPVAQSAPSSGAAGAGPSGGPSQKPSGEHSRAWSVTAIGLLGVAGGVAAVVAVRSYESSGAAREITPVSKAVAAQVPKVAVSRAAAEWSAGRPPHVAVPPVQSPDPSSRIPTVSVNDLPTAPRPALAPLPYRPEQFPGPAPVQTATVAKPNCEVPYYIDERGHKRFRAECLESPSSDASPAPKSQTSVRPAPQAPATSLSSAADPLATPH